MRGLQHLNKYDIPQKKSCHRRCGCCGLASGQFHQLGQDHVPNHVGPGCEQHVFLWTNIWLNYGDFTRPHPKRWFSKGIPRLFQKNLGWWNIIPFAQRNMCFDMMFGVLCVFFFLFFFWRGVLWGWEKNWMGMHLYCQGIPCISKYINLEPNLTLSPPAFYGLPIFQGHLGSRNVCIYIYIYISLNAYFNINIYIYIHIYIYTPGSFR